jgi:RNA polymerase sigma-70 factor (ECF subfamily)
MSDALRPFFEEWYPRLVRHLRVRLEDPDQAEDIAQEAFVRLLDHTPDDPVAWLYSVAIHLATDQARVARGRARHLSLIRAERAADADPGPEHPMLHAEMVSRVRRVLNELSDRDRELLLLHHEGWRYREIAERLGVAPSSVGPLLTRALRRFAATLTTEGEHVARQTSR